MIGSGFFGRVCEAKLLDTGERVCLKELQHVDTASAKVRSIESTMVPRIEGSSLLGQSLVPGRTIVGSIESTIV